MSVTYGENPVLIQGDIGIGAIIKREIIGLPAHRDVFILTTSKILPPIEFIGGKTPRSVGDTCRMFLKIKYPGNFMPTYFFWDGIVDENLPLLDEIDLDSKKQIFEDKIHSHLGTFIVEDASGLATGRIDVKLVLLEKTRNKKAHISAGF